MTTPDAGADALAGAISGWLDDLPVELRRPNLTLLGRSTVRSLGRWMDENRGRLPKPNEKIFAIVFLPGGERVGAEVPLIGVGDEIRRDLRDAVVDALGDTGTPTLGVKAELSVRPAELARRPVSSADECRLKLLAYRGSPLRESALTRQPGPIGHRIEGGPLIIEAGSTPLLVQILRPGEAARNIIAHPGAKLHVAVCSKGMTELTFDLGHRYANELANLRTQIRLDELMSIIAALGESLESGGLPRLAERMPAAAMMVAYALMRGQDSGARDEAVDVVSKVLAGVPDPQVLFAELYARAGDTAAAIDALLRAEATGLPCFSYGLVYLNDRLRMYWRAANEHAHLTANVTQPPSRDVELLLAREKDLRGALDRVARFAGASDYSAALTMYVGIDPLNPSGGVVTKEQFETAAADLIEF